MNENYKVLELDKILEMLSSYSRLDFNKYSYKDLNPLFNIDLINDLLEKSDEGMKIVNKLGQSSFDYIHNIEDSVNKAIKNGILNEEQLYRIASQYNGIIEIKNLYNSVKFEEYPKTGFVLNSLIAPKSLYNSVNRVISNDFTIFDNASPELHRIRKAIIAKQAELRKKLDSIVHTKSDYLSEQLITIRNDRYVLPVKAGFKNSVRGIIHDESSSMQTVFIEPEEIVNINNDISTLRIEERQEIERLLRLLTIEVAKDASILLNNLIMLKELDDILTRGAFGISYDGIIANLSNNQEIKLYGARHPLIDKKKVIANDFELYKPTNQVYLITGPNTGGKTVSLKTVGLLTLMNQLGLAIPTNKKSTLGIFNNVYVDIGDDQNITESLSTFSSHLSKLTKMVKECDSKSLILVDEIGGGTDPLEGESLAMSLIEEFKNKDSLVMATTHYHNLKTYGLESDFIVNASMSFNKETLKPTYKLINGMAGRSYAFEIASSLSLPSHIIERAKKYKDKYLDENNKIIEKLEKSTIENANLKEELESKIIEQEKTLNEARTLKHNLEIQKEKIQSQAKEEVDKLVNNYKDQLDELMDSLKHNNDLKLHEIIDAKSKINSMFDDQDDDSIEISNEPINVGDKVRMNDVDRIGVVESINKNNATININGMSIKTSLKSLSKFTGIEKSEKKSSNHEVTLNKAPLEINIIGLTVEEGLEELDKYLDSSLRCNLKRVRIIHGFGTFRLRDAVWNYLKKKKFVSKYYCADQYEGGGGATIVELK